MFLSTNALCISLCYHFLVGTKTIFSFIISLNIPIFILFKSVKPLYQAILPASPVTLHFYNHIQAEYVAVY